MSLVGKRKGSVAYSLEIRQRVCERKYIVRQAGSNGWFDQIVLQEVYYAAGEPWRILWRP